MKGLSKKLGWAICALFCTIICARGQPAPGLGKAKEWIDQEVERHRWEINVNAGNLFKLGHSGTYQYYYLIKLNSRKLNGNKARALRFALSPFLGTDKQYFPGDTSTFGSSMTNNYNLNPMFVLGYEWQRIYGRTTLFGGTDLAGLLHWSKGTAYRVKSPWDDSIIGRGIGKYHKNMIWLSGFLGAKIFVNHRVSISIESHLRFEYGVDGTKTMFEKQFISRSLMTWKHIEPLPCYLINLSYNL